MNALEIAGIFGCALDVDDFDTAQSVLHANCIYDLGASTLTGPEAIAGSYKSNMEAGRAKMDRLEWGKCELEQISEASVDIHFTDYLYHNNESHVHRCKQRVTVGPSGMIERIEHINLPGEPEKLRAFYDRVGIP